MPRPKKCRRVEGIPRARSFKPQGIPMRDLEEIYLSLDGFEALRLVDVEGADLESAARRMGVSRHTVGRVLAEARRTVARAVVEGLALTVWEGDAAVTRVVAEQENPGEESMKIAISSQGPGLESRVDARFGRAAGFVVVDLATMAVEYLDNGASQVAAHGAGIQAADRVARMGVGAVLTGVVGPKAFAALQQAGIQIFEGVQGGTVAEAVERFRAGALTPATAPSGGGR